MIRRSSSSNNVSDPTQVIDPQVSVHTLEEKIVSGVQGEVDNVMTSFETRLQDAVLTAIENLVIPRVELAMESTTAS